MRTLDLKEKEELKTSFHSFSVLALSPKQHTGEVLAALPPTGVGGLGLAALLHVCCTHGLLICCSWSFISFIFSSNQI